MLLIRPELGGFSQPRAVVKKRFSEKPELYRMLTVAIGTLYSLSMVDIERTIEAEKSIGAERNCIVHGSLRPAEDKDAVTGARPAAFPPFLRVSTRLRVLATREKK